MKTSNRKPRKSATDDTATARTPALPLGAIGAHGANAIAQVVTDQYAAYHGDSCEILPKIPARSVHFSIFSPPFGHSLYIFSNSKRDLSNSRDAAQFAEHFRFVVKELLRVTVPGRICAVHVMNIPLMKERDGVIGLRDFRGEIVRLFQECGWIFHSEVCIWKDPVTQMQRTHALGLLHKTTQENSSMARQGLPDYMIAFRAPGEIDREDRVTHTAEEFPVKVWQNIASPVWMDINQSDTLQRESAREDNDERHITPLQLEVIRRCIDLWTNPGDVVLTPFGGIGSEGYIAVGGATMTGARLAKPRRAVVIELKDSYYAQAVRNLKAAATTQQLSLMDRMGAGEST